MVALWFLFKQEDRQRTRDARQRMAALCKEREWKFAERSVRSEKDVEGRPVRILSTRDLNELYRVAHRELVAVVDTCSTRVLCDPRDDGSRLSYRRTRRLDRLVQYKTVMLDPPAEDDAPDAAARQLVDSIAAVVENVAGRPIGDTDPRALPFLPFDLGSRRDGDLDLDTEQGRSTFDDVYGPSRSRRDARDLLWKLDPRVYHGRDRLLIKGAALPKGHHWDVQIERGSAFLCMAAEVWHLKRGQYLNVYPDMYSRTTRQGAKKVWPKNT